MGMRSKMVLQACLKQKILYAGPEAFRLHQDVMQRRRQKFKVLEETVNKDGTVTVVLVKQYNDVPLLV